MTKKTWDEKYNEWRVRHGSKPNSGLWYAYDAGRRHQRKAYREEVKKLKAFLVETLESNDVLTVAMNRLGAENKVFKMERHSLMTDLNRSNKHRKSLIIENVDLQEKLAKKWWQFWRK